MTKYEKLVVGAYTGFLMVDWEIYHEYIEKVLGRPVMTHELSFKSTHEEIRAKLKPEFVKICSE